MSALPSIKQMVVRSNGAHRIALAAIDQGRKVYEDCSPSIPDLKGMTVALKTLVRWKCIQHPDGAEKTTLTERGHELLQALRGGGL